MSLFKRKSRSNSGENEEKPKRELTPEQIAEKEEARKSRKRENEWVTETQALTNEISVHFDQHPGTTIPSKYMHNVELRQRINRIHDWRCWMKYVASFMFLQEE